MPGHEGISLRTSIRPARSPNRGKMNARHVKKQKRVKIDDSEKTLLKFSHFRNMGNLSIHRIGG